MLEGHPELEAAVKKMHRAGKLSHRDMGRELADRFVGMYTVHHHSCVKWAGEHLPDRQRPGSDEGAGFHPPPVGHFGVSVYRQHSPAQRGPVQC